jgi:YebC/PmpR family DNA-binding regulatory protein
MSGHSKWASIKHQKGVADARRGQLFTKLTREIIIAVRDGGASADTNFRLRLSIQKARDANMPLDNIERAIKRGSGDTEGAALVELSLEGYGPGGAAIMVQTLSDNRNRSLQEVRNVFSRNGSNLGEAGCVAWMFEKRGTLEVPTEGRDAEELELAAIDAGADDVVAGADYVTIYTAPENLEDVRKALEAQSIPVSSAELSLEPSNTVTLEEKTGLQTLRLIDKLEELDDVQNVYSNADIADEIVEKYHSG